MSIAQASSAANATAQSIVDRSKPTPEQQAIGYLPIKVWNLGAGSAAPHPGYVRRVDSSEWSPQGPEPNGIDALV